MLGLPQSYPSQEHIRSGGARGSSALVVAGAGGDERFPLPAPLLLEDISELSYALGTLFEQVGGSESADVVTELVQTMAELYFPTEGGSGSGRSTLVSVLGVIGQRAMSVHRQLGEALFYFSLAERFAGSGDAGAGAGAGGTMPESAQESFSGALISVLQVLSVQLQGLVRPTGTVGGGEDARDKVRGDARRLLGELFALSETAASGAPPGVDVSVLQAALNGASRGTVHQVGRLCCVLCNLETCASFLDLCREIDQQGLSAAAPGGGSDRASLELDVMALVDGRMKPLVWHFVDPAVRDAMPDSSGDGGFLLFKEIVPLPLLPQDEAQVQAVQSLLRGQSRGSLGIYKDLLQHCTSYLQRLLSYVRHGYGSSYTVESDRRLVEDMLQLRQRVEGVITSF
jgi:hypothetical protein